MKMLRFASVAAVAGLFVAAPAMANFGHWNWGPSHAAPAAHVANSPSAPAPSGSGAATPVPEPADAALFGLGVAGVALGRRFRRKKG